VTLTQTLPINVPGLISVNTLNASVSSSNYGTAQEQIMAAAGAEGINGGGSTLLGVSALNLLNIGAVQSNCTSNASGSTGGTSIANLTIGNGTPINLPNDTTAPNTGLTATELGALANVVTIVLNKQTVVNTQGNTSIQVIGVQITLLSGLDAGVVINIAQSFCQATGPDIEAPPTITGITPHVGPATGGTTVTINGVGFQTSPTPVVDFGANPATDVTVVSSTQITAVSPPATNTTTNSTVLVTTSNQFGTSTAAPAGANDFTYEVVPGINANGIVPNSGPVSGGTQVTITGTNFGPDSVVLFCVPATPTDTDCTTVTPTVVNFNPTPPAPDTLTAYSPKSLLSGTGAGPEDVFVKDLGGTSTPAQSFTYFVPAVSVTSVTPDVGPVSHGTDVTIAGTGFSASSTVAFCTPLNIDTTCVPATGVTYVTPVAPGAPYLTAVTPSTIASASTYDVIVTTPQNNSTNATSPAVLGDQFSFEAKPTINPITSNPATTGINPDAGPVGGGTNVTIQGTGFVPTDTTTSVSFNGAAATNVVVVNATTITATSPASPLASPGTGVVQVTVSDIGGTSAGQPFTYLPAPTILPITTSSSTSGIWPDDGPFSGGTNVTIMGSGFVAPAVVTFAGNDATNVSVVSPTEITATSPAGAVGVAQVIVTDSGGASNPQPFTYLAPPTVGADGLNPAYGTDKGGTTVTITGSGLTGISSVVFGATSCLTGNVAGGVPGTAVTDSTTNPDTTATVVTPAYPTDGPEPVCITSPGGSAYALEEFTFESNPPVVTGLSPTSGTTAGGTLVTITGSGFGPGDPNAAVSFGGVAGTSVTVLSTTSLTVLTPMHAAGPVSVTMSDTAGGPVAAGTFTFVTPPPSPQIDGISPTSGPQQGGETVTIKGANLCNESAVNFGANGATNVTVSSDCTTLTVTEPAGSGTVPVDVTTPGGTAQSPENFTYIQPGYWEAAADGGVFAFGGAQFYGSVPQALGPYRTLDSPIVAMADTPDHGGYWLFAADGGVFTFGDANFYGSVPGVLVPEGRTLNGPIVAAEATPDGHGYRMFAADGGVFDFGDAVFEGSLPGEFITPAQPISGAVTYPFGAGPNPNNAGYWLVAKDGGIFTFGNAPFEGSAAGQVYGSVVSMATTPDGLGYYIFENNGGVVSEGDALSGLGGASGLNAPIVFGQATSTGKGYWEFAGDGGVFSFGDAPYEGSLGDVVLNEPITAGIAFGST
jgi:hypothetical protein